MVLSSLTTLHAEEEETEFFEEEEDQNAEEGPSPWLERDLDDLSSRNRNVVR